MSAPGKKAATPQLPPTKSPKMTIKVQTSTSANSISASYHRTDSDRTADVSAPTAKSFSDLLQFYSSSKQQPSTKAASPPAPLKTTISSTSISIPAVNKKSALSAALSSGLTLAPPADKPPRIPTEEVKETVKEVLPITVKDFVRKLNMSKSASQPELVPVQPAVPKKIHDLVSVKVMLPRDTSTIILCDERTTARELLDKSLIKLKMILGIQFARNSFHVRVHTDVLDSGEDLDLDIVLFNVVSVRQNIDAGIQPVLRVGQLSDFSAPALDPTDSTPKSASLDASMNDSSFVIEASHQRSTSMSTSVARFSSVDSQLDIDRTLAHLQTKSTNEPKFKLSTLRTRSVTQVNSLTNAGSRPSTMLSADSSHSLNTLSAPSFPSKSRPESENYPAELSIEAISKSVQNRYRPSSMYGIPHTMPQAFIVEFMFTLSSLVRLQMEIMGDESIQKIRRELWNHPSLPEELKNQAEKYVLSFAGTDGDFYELFDEQQIFHTLSILPYWRKNNLKFRLFAKEKKMAASKQVQLANKKIGNLIGFGLYRFEYMKDPEVDIFRRKMTSIQRHAHATRDPMIYKLQPSIDTSPLTECLLKNLGSAGKIHFRLHFPFADIVKTLTCQVEDTAVDVINIFVQKNKIHLPTNCESSDLVLKACGALDYLFGATRMVDFAYIRQCVLKDKMINLTLSLIKDLDLQEPAPMEEFGLVEDPCRSLGSHAQLTIEGRTEEEIHTISLWDIARNYRIQITACENLNTGTIESTYVEASLYHGGVLLCPSIKTHQVGTSRNPRWGEWLKFDVPCYNLPRTTRLCLTIWGRWNSKKKMSQDRETDVYPLGWVNMLLMDYKGYLRTGLTKMALWPGEKANPIGTCVSLQSAEEASIYVRLDSYAHPVIYPTEVYSDEYKYMGRDEVPLTLEESITLENTILSDPLTKIDVTSAALMWKNRYKFLKNPSALPKILMSVRWNVLDDVIESKKLLPSWEPMAPESALELLDFNFGDPDVRAYAVSRLELLSDYQLLDYMLQLVQVLKYEPYLDCALAQYLLRRALGNRIIGHKLFWHLRSEMDDKAVSLRFALLLEAYLRGCGHYMDDLIKQVEVQSKLANVAEIIKRAKNASDRKELLAKELKAIMLPGQFQLALDPKLEVGALVLDKCKYMDSKKLPLWCVFDNNDKTGQDVYIIFKSGDDLRQDMLTLQLIRIMEKLWQAEDMELCMLPYGCMSTGNGMGMIEVVLNAETVSNIQLTSGGSSAAFRDQPLDEWLRKQNPDEAEYEKAVETFTVSCAGYCVATYVLGIGDRHNDNIMITKYGHLFHIDFGHFLGNIKKKFGFKRERAPFVLTPDFVYVMGKKVGKDSAQFKKFTDYCVKAYLTLRRNANMFINLFAMMLSTGIPELKSPEDIHYLRDALCLGMSEEMAANEFRNLIFESLKLGWSTQLNWWLHNLVHNK